MYYALTNVKFDNSYKNACYFSTTGVREQALHPQNFDALKKRVNFNLGNVLFTSIIVNTYNNENYCIVHDDEKNNYYYYFVTSARYKAVNQWELELEHDVITQYITGANSGTFSNSNIIRAHCNRWITDGNNVTFNVSQESQIVKHESKLDKPVKERKNVRLNWFNNDGLDDWMASNVLCWMYLFVDKNHEFTATGFQGSISSTIAPVSYNTNFLNFSNTVGSTFLENDFSSICMPIYSGSRKIIIKDSTNRCLANITEDALTNFYTQNNGSQYVYNIKLSSVPPCNFADNKNIGFEFDESNNLVILAPVKQQGATKQGWRTGVVDVDCFGNVDVNGIDVVRDGLFVNVWQQFDLVDSKLIDTGKKFIFSKSEIKGKRKKEFEPKVLLDCYNIVLRDSSNGEYIYNLLKIGHQRLKVLYTEGLNITNNNYYYRLESAGLIPASSQDDWTGIVNTVDYSQTVANNNIDNFLSNNKNFLLTKGFNIAIPFVANMLTGNAAGAISNITNAIHTYIDYDNLQNRANSLRNANDGATLNLIVNEGLKLYVDIEKALDIEIESYYNYLYNFGYSVNKIDNPYNYINTRKYFNYLQFDADFININAPSNVEDKLKSIFRNGVRLWNDYSSIYNYTDENYENYL